MCAITQYHEASLYVRVHMPLNNCCMRLCVLERRKLDRSLICCFEVIFKDLAVPAVTVKLTLGSWFVLAVAMFY